LTPLETHENPPTYFETNKFTYGFQSIIDSYGVPRYQEINPTVFSIVTFPFMFGIMFGDVGHGIGLLCFALFMIYKEKEWAGKKLNELLELPFAGRYVILCMSLFAIYCGFLYNEFFAVPMKICPTTYTCSEETGACFLNVWTDKDSGYKPALEGYPKRTYEFGIDWQWKGATNELLYYNSLKMKMSIIIGVTHMSLGIVMKFLNSIYFNQKLDLFFECIPQLLLLLSLFGYLSALIFIKWAYPFYSLTTRNEAPVLADAPLLLTVMIFMFLSPASAPPAQNPKVFGDTFLLYKGQVQIQIVLLIVAFLCVPTMLLVKPLVLKYTHKSSYSVLHEEDEENAIVAAAPAGGHGHGHGEHFDFGEVFIHQIIETIEFVLGTVSNTASYLRLWALSLAHSELATVFWTLGLIKLGLSLNPAVTFLVWGAFVGASVGVLMVLETLSAFLHALRLHWVEFMNKFFKGDGHAFIPFSYKTIALTEAL
jgi:V-type H+-transporting ATPase subunit a